MVGSPFPLRSLTLENWSDPDPVSQMFAIIAHDGTARPISANEYVAGFLEPELSPDVPTSIRALFETARGALCYGWFFHPLCTLASDQLYRVVEAALRHQYRELGNGRRAPNFSSLIDAAFRDGRFPEHMRGQLNALRELRNHASHPENQTIIGTGSAQRTLSLVADFLNTLFHGQ